jgi:hypothetical protein
MRCVGSGQSAGRLPRSRLTVVTPKTVTGSVEPLSRSTPHG